MLCQLTGTYLGIWDILVIIPISFYFNDIINNWLVVVD